MSRICHQSVLDKEIAVTIEKMEEDKLVQSILSSNELKYLKGARDVVLKIYPSFNGFRRQVRSVTMHLFREVLERGIRVRTFVPAIK